MGTGKGPDKQSDAGASPRRILVTGAAGQIGAEFVPYLRALYGDDNVISSDIKAPPRLNNNNSNGHNNHQHQTHHQTRGVLFPSTCSGFVYCDVQDYDALTRVVLEQGIDTVVHLASLLSAIGEKNPQLALKVNCAGIQNVLEVARLHDLTVLAPSTIAVFGGTTPRDDTPDVTVCEPSTMYGVTKVHLELLGSYYKTKYDLDFRSLRYPGVISSLTPPGGGTTDYAVDIYHAALRDGHYRCFLEESTRLPMMYMRDCLRAATTLLGGGYRYKSNAVGPIA